MRHRPASLRTWQKQTLYGAFGTLWGSGVLWLILKYGFGSQGGFESGTASIGVALLKLHGAAAMGSLLILGFIFFQHVPEGWREKYQRPSGLSLLIPCGILIITAWGLYYIGNEGLRHWTSLIHSVIGVAFPLLLVAYSHPPTSLAT